MKYFFDHQPDSLDLYKIKNGVDDPVNGSHYENFGRYSRFEGAAKSMPCQSKSCQALAFEERIAILVYTTGNYHAINTVLALGNQEQKESIAPLTRVISCALRKMPKYEGTVYRGVNISNGSEGWQRTQLDSFRNKFAVYLPNSTVVEDGFFSTSMSGTMDYNNFTVRMIISSKNGRIIGDLSPYAGSNPSAAIDEEEVLFDAGTNFLVTNRETVKNEAMLSKVGFDGQDYRQEVISMAEVEDANP
jgi:hypothetical protein